MNTTNTTTASRKLTEEQAAFAWANYGLIVKACNSYKVPEALREDSIQAGLETLLRKIPDFDSSRAKFSTFIYPWLHNTFNDVQKENGDGMTRKPSNTEIKTISLEKEIANDGNGNSLSLSDMLPAAEDTEREATDNLMNEQLYRCMERLDSRENFILNRRFNLDRQEDGEWSLREIALALGTTRTTVSNVLERAQEKLRCMLEYGAGMRGAA